MTLIKDAKYYKYLEDHLPSPMPLLTNQEIKALIALRTDTINDMELELTELKDTVSMLRFELAAREAFK
jgi:hypothetical protein